MMDKINTTYRTAETNGAQQAPQSAKKLKGASADSDFAVELSQAGMVAAMPAQPLSAPTTQFPQGMNGEVEGALAKSQQGLTARDGMAELATNAEKSPVSMKSAASMNTAAGVAGLKPWSRDWIFEGGMDRNPDLKPLLGEQAPNLVELLAQAAQDLRSRGEAAETAGQQAPASAADQELATQFASKMQQGLEAQLQALGGGVEHVSEQGKPANPSGLGALPGSGISGAEFMTTLNGIRGGQDGRAGQQFQSGSEGGSQDRKSGASLKMIEGGLKGPGGKKNPFLDDLVTSRVPTEALHGVNSTQHAGGAMAPKELTGHVVKGAMSQDRLSSESLTGISTSIRSLTPQGGGEMRVRLNPDNLGELHIRVVTQGNQVGLQIQASDEQARKVIEESMSHLKDSMASQQLSLSRIDLSVSQPSSADLRQDSGNSNQGQQQNSAFFGDLLGQNRGQNSWSGSEGSDRWSQSEPSMRSQSVSAASGAGRSSMAARAAVSNGRLDVRA